MTALSGQPGAHYNGPMDGAQRIALWRADPLVFFHDVWGDECKLWSKQLETVESVRDNFATVVHSGIETGKGWLAARLMIWFYCTRFPAKVLGTATSHRQLHDTLWGEVDKALREARVNLQIDQLRTMQLRRLDPNGEPYGDDWFQLRKSRDVEGMHGIHLKYENDVPRVMIVIDEGSGLHDEFCQALEGQAHILLVQSNPLRITGYLADKIRLGNQPDLLNPGRLRWNIIHIDAELSPNVMAGKTWDAAGRKGRCPVVIPGVMSYGDFLDRMDKWDKSNIRTRIHGLLVDDDAAEFICPRRWLEIDGGEAWEDVAKSQLKRGPFYLGVDASRGRGDSAAWFVIDRLGIVEVSVKTPKDLEDEHGMPDTTQLADETRRLMRKYDIPAKRVCVDAGGEGQGAVGDPLRKQGQAVRLIEFGGGVPKRYKKTCKNMRALLYLLLSQACDPRRWIKTGDLDDDGNAIEPQWAWCMSLHLGGPHFAELEMLFDELCVIPKTRDGEGKLALLPKDPSPRNPDGPCLRQLIGRSPDRADALALAIYARDGSQKGAPTVDRPLVVGPPERTKPQEDRPEDEDEVSWLEKRLFGAGGYRGPPT